MPDYLEECLDNMEQLLKQVRRSEQQMLRLGQTEDGAAETKGGIPAKDGNNKKVSSKKEIVYDREKIVNQNNGMVDIRDILDEIRKNSPGKNVNQEIKTGRELELSPVRLAEEGPERGENGHTTEEEKNSDALASQLKQLDAAAAAVGETAWTALTREKRQGGDISSASLFASTGSKAAGAAEESWAVGSGLSGTYPGPGGEILWVEQADRAFRRDSRRYDGGFYLY